ncbi:MAG: response regulator [bacterium]|nr:response regulator [bacterium]
MDKQKGEKEEIRILYVDDEEDAREVFSDILKYKGYEVDTAKDGYEAIEKVKKKSYSVILTDIKMPGLSGIDMFKEIKKINLDLPILMITGYPRMETAVELMKLGAFAYISKPIELDKLYREIEVAIEKEKLIIKNKELFHNLQKANKELEVANQKVVEYNKNLEKMVEEKTKELKESQKRLIQAEKSDAMSEMATAVAHELRNSLCSIEAVIYCLDKKLKEDRPDLLGYLNDVKEETGYINRIIENIISFTQPSKPIFLPEAINNVIEESLAHVKQLLKNAKVIEKLEENLPKILINKDQIKQVFTNLIINAHQSMEEEEELIISTKKINNEIEVKFQDNGCGISKENFKNIFLPFFTTKAKGLGLGLNVANSIIKEHKGKILVESEVEKGTVFIVKLPIKRE